MKAETQSLRKDAAIAAADVAKVKSADWTSRIAFKGDLRYRYEFTSDESTTAAGVQAVADRYRDRLRARLVMDAKVADDLTVGLGIATGENGDPRSSNQTLTGVFNRKAFDLDLAYFDWKFASFGNLIVGKMKQPFFKPSQSVYFDSDVNPEGVAVAFNRGRWFGSAYGYFVNEIAGAENTRTADTMLYGGQVGYKLPLGKSNLTLAAMYYDLAAGEDRAPFFANNANGNTVVGGVLLTGGGGAQHFPAQQPVLSPGVSCHESVTTASAAGRPRADCNLHVTQQPYNGRLTGVGRHAWPLQASRRMHIH